jgi:hypothetical protein
MPPFSPRYAADIISPLHAAYADTLIALPCQLRLLIRCHCAADYAATPRHFDYFAIDFAIAAFTLICLSPLFRHFRHYCRFIRFFIFADYADCHAISPPLMLAAALFAIFAAAFAAITPCCHTLRYFCHIFADITFTLSLIC